MEQDLELDGDEESKNEDGGSEAKKPSKVGLKKSILNANRKEGDADDDEVNLGDPQAEDVKDDANEGAKSGLANDSDVK